MSDCNSIRERIDLFLDDELGEPELADFRAHVECCASCSRVLDRTRGLLDSIRSARPLYLASPELRERAERVTSGAPKAEAASPGLRNSIYRSLLSSVGPQSRWRAVTLSVLAIALIAAAAWYLQQNPTRHVAGPSAFAMIAVDNHVRRNEGTLPFEITSDSPEEISRWFAGKLSFSLHLPNYQESSGQERLYSLEGARLVALNNDYAAYVGYRMGLKPISLVVTSEKVAQPIGGSEIVSKGITFHYDSVDGLKVITWSDRGLTYGLVSSLEERGQQSCMVCHQGTKDQEFIDSLKQLQ